MKGVGYIDRWIKLGGRRGVVVLDFFRGGSWLFFLGPLRLQYLGKRVQRSLFPWRSRITGSIHWIRFCFGLRG